MFGRVQDGLAQPYIPVAGGEDGLARSRRIAAEQEQTQEPIIRELRHSVANSGSPKPPRACSQSSSVTAASSSATLIRVSGMNFAIGGMSG